VRGARERAYGDAGGTAQRLQVVVAGGGVAQSDRHDERCGQRAEGRDLGDLAGLAGGAECAQRRGERAAECLVEPAGTGCGRRAVRARMDANDQRAGVEGDGVRWVQPHSGHVSRC
jgi:hypothetical protein